MTHPVQARVERAAWWRDHLRCRCRPGVRFTSKRRVLVAEIKAIVAAYYGVEIADLLSKSRAKADTGPRQVAMFLAKRFTNRSYPWIGDQFGGRDHSTVMHACSVVEERIGTDPDLRDDVEELAKRVSHGL